MYRSCVLSSTFSLILVLSVSVKCRRYNIEEEARAFYGEDVKTILARFRRTPDYMKILEEKEEALRDQFDDVATLVLIHYTRELRHRVSSTLGIKLDKAKKLLRAGASRKLDIIRRAGFVEVLEHSWRQGSKKVEEKEAEDNNTAGIRKLEKYGKLHSPLTTQERNEMRNLGFEFAGHSIHAVIKHLSDGLDRDDDIAKSTLMPPDDESDKDKRPTTTEHVSIHTVEGAKTEEPATESDVQGYHLRNYEVPEVQTNKNQTEDIVKEDISNEESENSLKIQQDEANENQLTEKADQLNDKGVLTDDGEKQNIKNDTRLRRIMFD